MIELIEGYFVYADENQYILAKNVIRTNPKTKAERPDTAVIGYYGKIGQALQACLNDIIRNDVFRGNLTTLKQTIEKIQEVSDRLSRIALDDVMLSKSIEQGGSDDEVE